HTSAQYYTDENVPQYEFDLDRANQLLDEAGYPRGSNGTRFQLNLDYQPAFSTLIEPTAEYVRQQLGKLGIEVKLNSSDFAGFINRVYKNGEFDMTVNFFFAMPDPTIGLQR